MLTAVFRFKAAWGLGSAPSSKRKYPGEAIYIVWRILTSFSDSGLNR
jgi:hypothetical protein